ncbi:MAG: hypothetical protein ACAH59_01460 [Pseudobdellovibrionaceae bacterium]
MKAMNFNSKLMELQGDLLSERESEQILNRLREILSLKRLGQLSFLEAGTQIRQTAWKVAEDLRLNDLDLSTETDQILLEKLPELLES